MATKRRRRRSKPLGYQAKTHAERAHHALDAYEESVGKAVRLAREGKCEKALEEAVYAGWMRGAADSEASAGKVKAYVGNTAIRSRFYEGGPGIAQRELGYVLDRCRIK